MRYSENWKSSKGFLSFVSYVLRVNHPPYDYTPVSKFWNLFNPDIKRKILGKKLLII